MHSIEKMNEKEQLAYKLVKILDWAQRHCNLSDFYWFVNHFSGSGFNEENINTIYDRYYKRMIFKEVPETFEGIFSLEELREPVLEDNKTLCITGKIIFDLDDSRNFQRLSETAELGKVTGKGSFIAAYDTEQNEMVKLELLREKSRWDEEDKEEYTSCLSFEITPESDEWKRALWLIYDNRQDYAR